MSEIEGFRYRAKDAMRAVTSVAVREARLKEIKTELLNSQKLKVLVLSYHYSIALLACNVTSSLVGWSLVI